MRKIAIIPGDGLGSEVTAEAVKVLEAVIERSGVDLQPVSLDFNVDEYMNTGVVVPDERIAELKKDFDAIFVGALIDPNSPGGKYSREVLNELRLKLNLFINYRPVKLLNPRYCPLKDKKPENIDFVVLRDNLEGPHPDLGVIFKKGTLDEEIIHQSVVTRRGVREIIHYAFEYARKKGLNEVIICGGHYSWQFGTDLWTSITDEIGQDYPEIKKSHLLLEDLISEMLHSPEKLDVIVSCSTFGDVIADIGTELQGGMGLAFEGNLNPGKVSLYMPVPGPCVENPRHNVANPMAAISAVALMLENLGLVQEAGWINGALKYALDTDNTTGDLGGRLKCCQVGDFIADQIKRSRTNKIK